MGDVKKGKAKPIIMIVVGIVIILCLIGIAVMVVKGASMSRKVESSVTKKEIKAAKENAVYDDEDEDSDEAAGTLLTPINEKIVASASGLQVEGVEADTTKKDATAAGVTGDYVFPNSDTDYLSDSDVAGLSKDQLRIARNEILARHGRIFDSADLKTYFEGKSWYEGTIDAATFDANMDSRLNDCERANIEKIKGYE